MRRITTRFVLLIASAAIAPLVLYGLVSILRLQDGTRESVTCGQLRVAQQVAERIAPVHRSQHPRARSVGLESAWQSTCKTWQQDTGAEGLRPRFSGVHGDHVLLRRRTGHSDEPCRTTPRWRFPTRRPSAPRALYIAPAADRRRRAPAHDDRGPGHARLAGKPPGSSARSRSRSSGVRRSDPRGPRGLRAARGRGTAPHRARQPQQEAATSPRATRRGSRDNV